MCATNFRLFASSFLGSSLVCCRGLVKPIKNPPSWGGKDGKSTGLDVVVPQFGLLGGRGLVKPVKNPPSWGGKDGKSTGLDCLSLRCLIALSSIWFDVVWFDLGLRWGVGFGYCFSVV